VHNGAAVRNAQADVGWNENAQASLISAQDLDMGAISRDPQMTRRGVSEENRVRKITDETGLGGRQCVCLSLCCGFWFVLVWTPLLKCKSDLRRA
jgi:hypothetical protein